MTPTLFVDGLEGTTGLKIHEYLAARTDIQLLTIDPDKRKDSAARKSLLNAADVAILCLPDAASREAVALIDNPATRVIDASTAFRTDPAWAYGLPELSPAAARQDPYRPTRRESRLPCHRIPAGGCAAGVRGHCFKGGDADEFFDHRIFRRRKKDDHRV